MDIIYEKHCQPGAGARLSAHITLLALIIIIFIIIIWGEQFTKVSKRAEGKGPSVICYVSSG